MSRLMTPVSVSFCIKKKQENVYLKRDDPDYEHINENTVRIWIKSKVVLRVKIYMVKGAAN